MLFVTELNRFHLTIKEYYNVNGYYFCKSLGIHALFVFVIKDVPYFERSM